MRLAAGGLVVVLLAGPAIGPVFGQSRPSPPDLSGATLEELMDVEPALKAAFIYNFARFTEWPADVLPPTRPLKICVADAAVADALEQIAGGRSIDQRPVAIARVIARDALRSCHILYVTDSDADVIGLVRDAPVFSVGDSTRFISSGGIAQFIVQRGRLRFAINVDAARRARLRLSSRLLRLATTVKDPNHGR